MRALLRADGPGSKLGAPDVFLLETSLDFWHLHCNIYSDMRALQGDLRGFQSRRLEA